MSVDDFIHLLRRYGQQECSPDEVDLIDRWYDRLRAELEPRLTPDERFALQQYLWQRIERRMQIAEPVGEFEPALALTDGPEPILHPSTIKAWRRPRLSRWAVAAAVVVVGMGAALSYYLNNRDLTVREALPALTELVVPKADGTDEWRNTTRKSQQIKLDDGSTVQLEPGSQLHFAAPETGTKREVWLTGRAFFCVKRDEKRPFLVYTGAVVTRVLGTSFWVNAPANASAVDVSVRTGRVWVSRSTGGAVPETGSITGGHGVVLTPNQQVTFYTDKSQWDTGLVARPQPLKVDGAAPAEVRFGFDESPLPDVLKAFADQYGIEITAGDNLLENCRFTGDISGQPFFTQLELVCRAINASYEVVGTRIQISGPGCNPY